MIVLNSRTKPGGFPTLYSGTNNVDIVVLTLSNNGLFGAGFSLESAALSGFGRRPPQVALRREDWAEVRRRPYWGSEVDLGGGTWKGEWGTGSPS